MVRLHVNVDHVATVRQARGGATPDPVAWALEAEAAGAHGITCHLRRDRRHIQDADLVELRRRVRTVLNLECSLEGEQIAIAQGSGAENICIVPEGRSELTTEGGLDVIAERDRVARAVAELSRRGALVSVFVEPEKKQLAAASELGAPFVELHTGAYAGARGVEREFELARLRAAASFASALGLRVNAGHGLDYDNVAPVAQIAGVEELNIGHAIVSRALFIGVRAAIREMLDQIGA